MKSNEFSQRLRLKLTHPFNGMVSGFYIRLNRFKFRFLGVRLGKGACIRNSVHLVVLPDANVKIGNNFTVNSGGDLNPLCNGSRTCIKVSRGAVLSIGDHSGMSGGTLWVTSKVIIGNYVNIGANCHIIDSDIHSMDWKVRREDDKHDLDAPDSPAIKSPIRIDDDVWIGADCIILKGVHIGARSVIGAGSVVTKDIPADCIAAGNPCRVIRYPRPAENADRKTTSK